MSDTGRLGEFEVIRRIGAGGMAEVFLAKKRGAKGTEKRLVVKRLLPQHARSERLRTMFVHEAHLAIRLDLGHGRGQLAPEVRSHRIAAPRSGEDQFGDGFGGAFDVQRAVVGHGRDTRCEGGPAA